MPVWTPQAIWEGKDAFVLGGGPSLRGFDWSRLYKERVVGCNQAFRLGPQVCDYVVFCDRKFILTDQGKPRLGFYDGLAKFPNPVVTTDSMLKHRSEPWLKYMPRRPDGLHHDALGFNCSTGWSAVNLAFLLGATTVYLLGFDMQLGVNGESNYHGDLIDTPDGNVYVRMLKYSHRVNEDLPKRFPGRQVFNVFDVASKASKLDTFPIIDACTFWSARV